MSDKEEKKEESGGNFVKKKTKVLEVMQCALLSCL
jgi:hypothetical protein